MASTSSMLGLVALTVQRGKAHATETKRRGLPVKGSKLSILHDRALFRDSSREFYSGRVRVVLFSGQALDQCGPLVIERWPVKASASAAVPIVSVRGVTRLAVEISMNRHSLLGFKGVDQIVGAGPVALCVPPKGREGGGKAVLRGFLLQGSPEVVDIHGLFVAPGMARRNGGTVQQV
jgi:hypothetical protein